MSDPFPDFFSDTPSPGYEVLLRCVPETCKLVPYASGVNVVKVSDGYFANVALRADPGANDVEPGIVFSDERIAGQGEPIMVADIGIKWPNGECCPEIPIEGCLVYDQEPLDKLPAVYMRDYLYVGVPLARYNWFLAEGARVGSPIERKDDHRELKGIMVSQDQTSLHQGYVFMCCSLPRNGASAQNCVNGRLPEQADRFTPLGTVVADLGSSVLGTVIFTVKVVRVNAKSPIGVLIFMVRNVQVFASVSFATKRISDDSLTTNSVDS